MAGGRGHAAMNAAPGRARFHALPVAEVRRETPDAVSVALAVPPELREAFRFTPGQYLTLRRVFDGEEVRRSYSICAGLDDGELRVGIKRVAGGRSEGDVAGRLGENGGLSTAGLRV